MYKLKLNQVREVLGMEVKLESAKLQDGVTVVEYEKLEPGMPLFVISEDGSTKSPAPEGYHILEDGTSVEVDAQGIIKEISAEAEEAAEEVAEEAPVAEVATVQVSGEEVPAEANPMDVAMTKIEEKMRMVFEAVEEVAKEVSSIKEEMGAMKTKMEKFAKAPAAVAAPKVTNLSAEEFGGIDSKVALLNSLRK